MKVLVIGSGGREHALSWKIAQSPIVKKVYVAPGNGGTELEDNISNVNIDVGDIEALSNFALDEEIDLTIVGPEDPLVSGITDIFIEKGLKCFGPSKEAAQLEGSKEFMKQFLKENKIPTAEYQSFKDAKQAIKYVEQKGCPIVTKADGLAAGKGVIVAMDEREAEDAIRDMLAGNAFGEAGSRVVIEEFLEGEEASFIVMVDGKNILPFATSQDHKRAYNGDEGPNTGGMGAYSPAPVVTDEIHQRIMNEVIVPTVEGMASEGHPYTGFLYAGLMIDAQGTPKVIEYNCRFGDPETQPMMLRLKSDLVELVEAANREELDKTTIEFDPRAAVGVVLAAKGYPGDYPKGDAISGLKVNYPADEKVFHAGTKQDGENVVTAGGRVLCATALGNTVTEAQQRAYELVKQISWEGMEYRTDIAYRAIAREQ